MIKKIIRNYFAFAAFIILLATIAAAQEFIPFESAVAEKSKETIPFADLTQKGTEQVTFIAPQSIPFGDSVQQISAEEAYFSNLVQKETAQITPQIFEKPLTKKQSIIFNWLYVAAPVFLVVGFLVYVETKRKKAHIELIAQKKQHQMNALRDYMMVNLKRGYSKKQIVNALLKNNYNNQEIEEALKGMIRK